MSDSPISPEPAAGRSSADDEFEVMEHHAGATEVLPAEDSTRGRRRRWPLILAAGVTTAVAGAGIALGMVLSGGGTQPEELVPADALAYADIDFDPPAGQKVNLMRLLGKFPQVREELGDEPDVKQYLIENLMSEVDGEIDAVDEWFGDRAGVAALWAGGDAEPTVVLVLQVNDEDAARNDLTQAFPGEQMTFEQGYAILTPPGEAADDVVSSANEASLADDDGFQQAFEPLDDGMASFYVDGEAVASLIRDQMGMLGLPDVQDVLQTPLMSGQAAAVLRIEPSSVELIGRSTQTSDSVGTAQTELFSTLPDNTAAALAIGGGSELVARQWEQLTAQLDQLSSMSQDDGDAIIDGSSEFRRAIAQFEAEYNIRLPEDVMTLLGDDFVLAADGDNLVTAVPQVGMRSVTDPDAARDLAARLQPLIDKYTAGLGVEVRAVDDGLVIASTPDYADVLVAGNGNLASDPSVAAALPQLTGANTVVWVDLDTLGSVAQLVDPEAQSLAEPLSGFGLVVGEDDDGSFLESRLTFDE